jgi:hypothetical protein
MRFSEKQLKAIQRECSNIPVEELTLYHESWGNIKRLWKKYPILGAVIIWEMPNSALDSTEGGNDARG